MKIVVHLFGEIPLQIVNDLVADLRIFDGDVEIGGRLEIPPSAYDRKRGQYIADSLLAVARAQEGDKVLAVSSHDMNTKSLSFVFGEADVGGRGAVISIARLRNADGQKFRDRVAKEALHELGHTFGLDHCRRITCVMHFSSSLADTDVKSRLFCDDCVERIPTAWRPRQKSPESC